MIGERLSSGRTSRAGHRVTRRRLRVAGDILIDGVTAVLRYLASGGDPCVSKSYVDADGIRIGSIIGSIRHRHRVGKLPRAVERSLEQYDGWIWDVRDQRFEEGFARLRAYVASRNDSRVPEGHQAEDGFHLAEFVSGLRRRRRKERLTPEQMRRLESLPHWSWDPFDDDWNECFTVLAAHLAAGGAAWAIPRSLTSSRGYRIHNWAAAQRRTRAVMRAKHPERHQRLSALAGWEWQRDRWRTWYELLRVFAAKHGHTRVRQHEVVQGRALGRWVSQQRFQYANGELPPKRAALLKRMPGWLWDASLLNWEHACDELAAYVDVHGHSAVPYEFVTRTKFGLGTWVSRVRKLLREGSLDPQRRKILREALRDERLVVSRSLKPLV